MESNYKKNTFCIIVPMFNEEKVVDKCIEGIMGAIKKIKQPTKVLVINDGSFDNTATLLKEKKQKYNSLIILTHKKNKGYGKALQSGTTKAIQLKFTWALHMDSDLTNDPKYIKDFIQQTTYDYDCIKASRYVPGSRLIGVPRYRQIISYIGNHVASLFFRIGIKDCTNGFRMVKLAALKEIKFNESNFSIILEELFFLKKGGAKFKEIPYTLTVRKDSSSHFSYKPRVFYDYLKYVAKASLPF